jgi:putative sigma-54 modulation protein
VNLIVKGRGVDLNDRLRDYASARFTRAQRFFERIIKMEVEFSEERNPRVKARHKVEVTVKTPGETLRAHGAGTDYFTAIDQASNRLEAQVKKFKGRLIDRGHRADNHLESPRMTRSDGDERPVIVRQKQTETKPMTPEEAVLELETNGLQFILFTNAETMGAGVLYRRPDGTFGLVEAEG